MRARADQVMHPAEISFLREISRIFGFDDHAFERIRASHAGAGAADPYAVLGIAHDASDDEARAAWRALIREFSANVLPVSSASLTPNSDCATTSTPSPSSSRASSRILPAFPVAMTIFVGRRLTMWRLRRPRSVPR